MFSKSEKYTMEEFEKKFNEAQAKALEELSGKFDEAVAESDTPRDSMAGFAFNMQNMLTLSVLKKHLFGKED